MAEMQDTTETLPVELEGQDAVVSAPEVYPAASIKVPLPPVFGSVLAWSIDGVLPGLTITVKDLCDPGFVAVLESTARDRLSERISEHLRELMARDALPAAITRMELAWTPNMTALLGRQARANVKSQRWSGEFGTIRLGQLTKHLEGDVAGLLRMMARARTSAKGADRRKLQPRKGGTKRATTPPSRGTRIAVDAGLEPPSNWRPAPSGHQSIALGSGTTLSTDDPRFGWLLETVLSFVNVECQSLEDLQTALQDWLQITGAATCHEFEALKAKLAAAELLTAEQEMQEIALACLRRARDPLRASRTVCARYGNDGTPRSLDEVGDLFVVTRQSVLKTVQQAIAACQGSCYAPAGKRLLAATEERGEGEYLVVEKALRDVLGPSQSLVGAIDFYRDFLGWRCSLGLEKPDGRSKALSVPLWTRPERQVFAPLLKAARRIASADGAVHWLEAVAGVSAEMQALFTRIDFERAISGDSKGLWLDRASGWAAFADVDDSPLCAEIRMVLACAHPHAVAVGDLYAGLARVHASRPVGSDPVSVPKLLPLEVLVRLLESHREFIVDDQRVRLSEALEPLDLFKSAGPRHIFDAMQASGGVARWGELRARLPSPLDQPAELRRVLATLAFVTPLGIDAFAIRGRPIRVGSVSQLSAADAIEMAKGEHAAVRLVVDDTRTPVRVVLTQSKASDIESRRRVLYLPRPLMTVVHGTFAHETAQHEPINVVENRIHGLAGVALALGVQRGAAFAIAFDLAKRTYRIEPGHVAPEARSA